jgi:hypothetical protein
LLVVEPCISIQRRWPECQPEPSFANVLEPMAHQWLNVLACV